MSVQTITDFVASPASLEYLVHESSLVGLGSVVEEHSENKTENLTTVTGKVVVNRILFPERLDLPLSIAFKREVHKYRYLSDQVWGEIQPEEMNGLNVLIFASGSAEKWQLIGVVRLDKASQPGFIEDLVRIFRKESLTAPDITEAAITGHPVLASYALRKIFSNPDTWSSRVAVATRVFSSKNAALRESAFHLTMIVLRKCREDDPAAGSQLLALALKDLQSSDEQGATKRLGYMETLGAETIAKRADWSKSTLAILRQKNSEISKSAHGSGVLKRLTEKLGSEK